METRGITAALTAADRNSFSASLSAPWRPKGIGGVNLQLNTSSADFSGSILQSELNSPTVISMETNETKGVSAGTAAAAAAASPARETLAAPRRQLPGSQTSQRDVQLCEKAAC